MRKHLLLPSLFAVTLLLGGANLALAGCGGCAGAESAGSHNHGEAVQSAAAECPPGCSSACCVSGADGAAIAKAGAQSCAAEGDFFISNYMGLRAAMDKHCDISTTTAAANWHEGLQGILGGEQAEAHREALSSLAGYLADWPGDAEAQQNRFSQISEWTAGYCEMFPQKTAGVKVVTCPTSGHRSVELETPAGDSQS